jgi:hypothetical protein
VQIARATDLLYGGLACETAGGGEGLPPAPVLDTCEAGWTGSATVVDPSGLILTNHHLVVVEGEPTWSAVAVSDGPIALPRLVFFAWPMIWDERVDLAVLAPVYTLDGEPIGAEDDLRLDWLPIPDGQGADAGDALTLAGYPGLEPEERVSLQAAMVEERLPDEANPELGEAGWLDVGPFAGPGVGGGAAVDGGGVLAGVPTGGRGGVEEEPAEELVRPLPGGLELLVERARAAGQLDDPAEPTPVAEPSPDPGRPRTPRKTPPRAPAADTAVIVGTLVSADTGEPVVGGTVLALQPDVTIEEWADEGFDPSLVGAGGRSDGAGRFQLNPAVRRDQAYSVVILADGYEPLGAEGYVLARSGDPATVDLGVIELAAVG